MNYTAFLKIEMWDLLAKLNPETPAQWGIMSAQNMVEHLRMVFAMSLGFGKIKPFYDEEKTRRNYEFTIVQKNPLPRNLKLKDGFLAEPLPLEFADLAAANAGLKEIVMVFFERFEQANLATTHPVLGILNSEEWQNFHSAHVRHHFAQFDLL